MATAARTAFLFQPIPIYTLVWLRIAVGILGAFDVLGNGIYYHWYKGELAASDFHFPYFGFEWVTPFPEPWMSLYFIVGFFLGIAVAVGWKFRYTAPIFALAFSYLYLIEKAHYLNHAYLFIWICWLICLTPAWRAFSFDSWKKPSEWSATTPAWCLYLFPLLMGIVYFFGGIAKINHDWLLEGMPLQLWLEARANLPIIGPIISQDWVAYGMSWGGFLLDLTAPFLLLGRRSRWWILGFIVFFHLMNHLIFNIGIFPYLSLVLTSLFFEPDWPLRLARWLGDRWKLVARWENSWIERRLERTNTPQIWQGAAANQRAVKLGIALLIIVHCYLPIRHHLFPGDVAWTEEGHRYSWRMMLRTKNGYGSFQLVDRNSGEVTHIRPEDNLHRRQARKLYTHPDMILSYAHHLAQQAEEEGQDVAVYAHISVRLNNGKYGTYIDPTVDLSQIKWQWLSSKEWIMPPPNSD